MYRAVQKEAAELGAHAIIVEGPGIGRNYDGFRRGKALQALAIRWGTEGQGSGPHALSPTSTVSTTRDATYIRKLLSDFFVALPDPWSTSASAIFGAQPAKGATVLP